MVRTEYTIANADFSNIAHTSARQTIYPLLFGVDTAMLQFDSDTLLHQSKRGELLDGEMAIDRIVRVTVNKLKRPLVFTVQERFRRPWYSPYRDLTITTWNNKTNQPSELYKLEANLFVYGYFDEHSNRFGEVVALNNTLLLMSIANGTLTYIEKGNDKQQSFIALGFEELTHIGAKAYHYQPLIPIWPDDVRDKVRKATRTVLCSKCSKSIKANIDFAVIHMGKPVHAHCLVPSLPANVEKAA